MRCGGWFASGASSALAMLAGCSFASSGVGNDAVTHDSPKVVDARATDARSIDASDVTPIDAPPQPKRTSRSLVLRYDFNEAAGSTVVADTSGVAPAADLRVVANPGASPTFNGTSLTTNGPTALIDVATGNAGAKLAGACTTGEITVEAWITQQNSTTAGGRVLSFSKFDGTQFQNNLIVGSVNTDAAAVVRTQQAGGSGRSVFITGGISQAPQMLVARYGSGQITLQALTGPTTDPADTMEMIGLTGNFANWDNTFKLVLLNSAEYTTANARSWRGAISSISVYCRNLTDSEIANDRLLGSESL